MKTIALILAELLSVSAHADGRGHTERRARKSTARSFEQVFPSLIATGAGARDDPTFVRGCLTVRRRFVGESVFPRDRSFVREQGAAA